MRLTRLIAVDALTNEVLDQETGERLGEWIVWLNPSDVERGAALVMLSIGYYVFVPLNGKGCVGAVLALVNFSAKHGSDYVADGLRVRRERTAVGQSLPPFIRWRRYGSRAVEELEGALKDFRPFGCRVVDYRNRTADLVCDGLTEVYRSSTKPWRLSELPLGERGRELVMLAKVEYDELCAVASPESYELLYSTNGILLSIRRDSPTFSLPSLLTSYLKRGYLAVTLYTLGPFELSLVETNVTLEYPELGAPGSADKAAHLAALTAAAALICALLAAGRRLELPLVLALAMTLVPLLFLDDLMSPDPLELSSRGGLEGESYGGFRYTSLVLLHVNDTLTLEASVRGCEIASYLMRVSHVTSGESYEYCGRGPQLVLPTFTARTGGVYLLEVRANATSNVPCYFRLDAYAVRRAKPGFALLYRLEVLVGLALLVGVTALGVRKFREAA